MNKPILADYELLSERVLASMCLRMRPVRDDVDRLTPVEKEKRGLPENTLASRILAAFLWECGFSICDADRKARYLAALGEYAGKTEGLEADILATYAEYFMQTHAIAIP